MASSNFSYASVYALLLCSASLVNAEQISFKKEKDGDDYIFNYQWLNKVEQSQELAFSMNQESLFEEFRDFKTYKSDIAQQSIQQAIAFRLRKKPIKGVRISFQKQGEQYRLKLIGRKDEDIQNAEQQIAKIRHEETNRYFEENYYHRFTTHDLQYGIKPDHVRIANLSVDDLKPLKDIFLSKFSIQNVRNATDYTLSFVQSIPYSTLESRLSSSGAGFNPPAQVIWQNQGDCDSKVTLTAALLRMLMPRIKMVLVFIDQHALIGIEAPVQAGDEHIIVNEVTYVLAEPTGPRQMTLGEIAQSSSLAINSGHYVAEEFHEIVE